MTPEKIFDVVGIACFAAGMVAMFAAHHMLARATEKLKDSTREYKAAADFLELAITLAGERKAAAQPKSVDETKGK